jgi:hypothetical protein
MVVAPYRVAQEDYTVVARVRVVKFGSQDDNQVGVAVRVSDALDRASHLPNALLGGFACNASATIAAIRTPCISRDTIFSPGDTWHTIQVQIHYGNVGLLIDGRTTLQTTWPGSSVNSRVGLFVQSAQLEVSSFQVETLPYAGSQLALPSSCPHSAAPRAPAGAVFKESYHGEADPGILVQSRVSLTASQQWAGEATSCGAYSRVRYLPGPHG